MAKFRQRCKAHEITLIAFGQQDGLWVVMDIVETSTKFASSFMRRFYRDGDVIEVAAVKPGTPAEDWRLHSRTLYREQA